jgi:TonB family protein
MQRGPRIAVAIAIAVSLACSPRALLAQQRGTDVGGQPARRQLTKLPKLTTFVEAEYPPEKKEAGVEASVVLTIEIAATGTVTSVTVAQSAAPDFDAAAVAAARQFVFSPAEVDDKPAPSKITYRYSFVLHPAAAPPPPPVPVPVPVPESPLPLPTPPPGPTAPTETIEILGPPRPRRETHQTTIRADQARKIAGTQGDVLKVVQNLPGVSRPPVASGQIVVWGSAPRDTRIYVDGVDLPALYHGSGLRSVINSDLVSSIDLVPGAFGAEYGRGLGGLVRVETRALPRGTHGYVGADTLDGSALVSTELSSRARIAIAARQSWLDRVLAATSAPDFGDFFPIPRYRDGQLKATLDLRKREAVDAVLLGATDDLTRTVASPDPASKRSESNHTGFWRAYLRYTNVSENGDTAIVTPFFGHDASELVQRFGPTPARLDIGSTRYGVRAALRSRLGKLVSFTAGLDALGTDSKLTREGSLTLPPREGDVAVFGQPPGDEYATDTWRTNIVDVAPHVHADVKLGPVTVTPGVRVDAFLIEGDRKTPRVGLTPGIGFSRLEMAVAPRLAARWEVAPRLALNAAYGTYTQAPEPEDLSPVFGTPDLALSRATHVTVGESLRITPSLSADVVAFQKTMKDLVVRSRLTNPVLARALTQNGEGRSYGVQFLLRQELWSGFFGWVSYAISRSERRYEGDESWRAFDFDQPHVLSIVASQEIGRWSFGARFRYASGNPRTPVIGSTYDARSDRYDPVFGAQNSIRIPAFWQLDLRVDRSFELGKGIRMLLFADLQNVTNRENAEEIVYSASFRKRSTISGLPALAVVGARLEL